jgi:hypothetical protein
VEKCSETCRHGAPLIRRQTAQGGPVIALARPRNTRAGQTTSVNSYWQPKVGFQQIGHRACREPVPVQVRHFYAKSEFTRIFAQ